LAVKATVPLAALPQGARSRAGWSGKSMSSDCSVSAKETASNTSAKEKKRIRKIIKIKIK
jgi:hypothetical protein